MTARGRRRPALLAALLAAAACTSACGGDDHDDARPRPDAVVPFTACNGSDQAFVRQAMLAVLGRRPRSQAEVLVYADLMAQVRALAAPTPDPREVVVRALFEDPAYVDRWSEHVMDALKVPRIEDQGQRACYGAAAREPGEGIDDGSLARTARDTSPRDGGDGGGRFTMLDLLRSALHLDDLSIVYRAHLFAMVSRPIPAANVPALQAELARREDFGSLFDTTYLNRDLVCLGCHNSEFSVTFRPEPEANRHWPVPGAFESAIYGAAIGVAPERAHAAFRFMGLVTEPAASAVRPWEWDRACGSFAPDGVDPDPAGIDGKLASLGGDRLTVFDLEAALARGFDTLATGGLVRDDAGAIADPDAAMAYLVAATIVEGVWREVVGTPLTIANYFPRNRSARDLLTRLTDDFIASRYSLRELLVDITTSDYFNRLPPEAGCGTGPYNMPAVYDPWVTADPDPARRRNGPGDAIAPLSPRVLLRAAHEALGWPRPFFYAFPEDSTELEVCSDTYTCEDMAGACDDQGVCCEAYQIECASPPALVDPPAASLRAFERGMGIFLKRGDKGFRGLDFQARLVLEDAFGSCTNPVADPDFVADLVARARADPAATVGDVVAALKDRLTGDARVGDEPAASGAPAASDVTERAALEALLGAPLARAASDAPDLEAHARALCGVLLSSPQFLLGGMAAPDASTIPLLTPEAASYGAICSSVADRDLPGGLVLTCGDSALSVASGL
ncbi:MAG TPA: hypothetical protein VKB80_01265 [Kofleriaceae bacterium]|nr:hypothetical protein [Kofleriaceae bacterium]